MYKKLVGIRFELISNTSLSANKPQEKKYVAMLLRKKKVH